jgi:hypothetical protein
MKKYILFFFMISLLTSCASTSQYVKFANNSTKSLDVATIYVVRPSLFGSAIKMPVYCNGKLIGRTGPKSYLCWEVKEGEVLLNSTGENNENFTISAKAGKSYYIKQVPKMGLVIARVSLELLNEEEGKRLVSQLNKPTVKYTE